MAGLGDVTGTLRPGLCADMLVTSETRLDAGLDTLLA